MKAGGRKRAGRGRAPISLGDAIAAVRDLAPQDDAAREAVRALLGFERTNDGLIGEAADQPAKVRFASEPPGQLEPANALAATTAQSVISKLAKRPTAVPIPSQLTTWQMALTTPLWLQQTGNALAQARRVDLPPPAPIFALNEQRGIYVAALSTWVEEGDVDTDTAVRILAEGRSLTTVPRVPMRTLRRGVQLLIDRGPGMEPFAADAQGLERSVGRLMGANEVERFYFHRCPRRGVRETATSPRIAWRPPPRDMPLLVVSDFGIATEEVDADIASIDEWIRFAREVRGEGHALVGLLPFEPSRWPSALVEAITLVQWSERTSAGTVASAVRVAHRRTR
jgi:hypothetical protein